ncbi:MAG: lamin tail domain-containing protein [Myxococcales bacterium]|nr:lamin tail domain-containing protein [Myxococcales bacterium]
MTQTRAHQALLAAVMMIASSFFGCGAEEKDAFKLPVTDAGHRGFDAGADGFSADTGGKDAAPSDALAGDSATGGESGDATAADVIPGGNGQPCKTNDECDTNVCIDTPKGQICAATCIETCAAGFACKQLSGSDASYYCLPRWLHACEPCTTSDACQAPGFSGAACIDRGAEGSFCGTACDDSAGCPTGYACALVTNVEGTQSQQCLPKAGAACGCSPRAKKLKLSTGCTVKLKAGTCLGARSCGEKGLSACDAKPKKESCNGADDDCDGQTDEALCDDANSCTTDACDPALTLAGGCTYTHAPGACDADKNACTEGDACAAGVCKSGKTKNCDDNNPCTLDACLPASGCTQTADDGKACSDGDACSVGDVCLGGSCSSGAPKACKASGFCVTSACDKASGSCKEAHKGAGTPCTDDNACTTGDGCLAGKCTGTKVVCDDKNACTTDSCHPTLGCQTKANTQPCDDGNPCTAADVCAGGLCGGKAVNAKIYCDDGNPCTTDACDPKATGGAKKGCVSAPNKLPCDDGNGCTAGDVCSAGICKSGTNTCQCAVDADCKAKEDGDLCNGTLFCDKSKLPYKCAVNPKTLITCSKAGNTACKSAKCAPKTGKCGLVPANEGQPCNADGSVCTVGDLCLGGACKPGKTLACDDNNPCTKDVCDAKSGCGATKLGDKTPCGAGKWCISASCVASVWCGDGKVNQTGEQCDDGNTLDGDGCSKTCQQEAAINPFPGTLVISEIMVDPATEKYGEWFEIYNPGKIAIRLTGLIIGDGFGKETIKVPNLVLKPGAFFVCGNSATLGGGGKANYVYSYDDIKLSNKGDSVRLWFDDQLIDSVTYGGKKWPTIPDNKTFQLSPTQMTASKNNYGEAWCVATVSFGTKGAKGTPGAKNTPCQ